ncbi:unnamed protein product, partial [Ectocarpus sp. 13 AM-2016]
MATTDREALVTLFHSTGGTNWYCNGNWNTTAELFTWYGIKVDLDGRVEELRLASCAFAVVSCMSKLYPCHVFAGSIPKELDALANIRSLDLVDHELTGIALEECGPGCYWTEVNVVYSFLTASSIPKELGTLTKMLRLNLTRNKLAGKR